MKKLFSIILACMLIGGCIETYASQSPKDDKEQTDKKDNKKKKKEKKKKDQRSPQEVINDLKSLEWEKPDASGVAEYDEMFSIADQFITMLKTVDDSVTLYSIGIVVSESGDSILAPIDTYGNIKNKKEANQQTLDAVLYGTNVGLVAANLTLAVAGNAINIGQDAIPLVGDAKRKKANVQIAKATKGFGLLKELIGTQRKIMEKYMATNSDLKSGDVDVEALQEMNVDLDNVINMSDDEFNAMWDQQNGD